MICSEKCKLCELTICGHGDVAWECKITNYYAPISKPCPYSNKTIYELNIKE